MTRKTYSTDLNDSGWAILAPLIPAAQSGGHPLPMGDAARTHN
ncbi:transposase [Nostoc sp.]